MILRVFGAFRVRDLVVPVGGVLLFFPVVETHFGTFNQRRKGLFWSPFLVYAPTEAQIGF